MHSPRTHVSITVTVVFGVGAVVFDAAGALLYPRSGAPPVAVPLVGSPDPPGERDTVWEPKPKVLGSVFHTQSHILSFICLLNRLLLDDFEGVTWRVEQPGHPAGVRHILLTVLSTAGHPQHLRETSRRGHLNGFGFF